MTSAWVLAAALLPAFAAAAAPDPADEFAGELASYSRKLAALPPSTAECRAAYAALDARGPLTIGVFFGFIDTARKNYAADGDFKRALVRQLTEPCSGNLRACGFVAAPDDPALPNRTRLTKTSDGRAVVIDAFDSSLSSDYAADVGPLSERQEERSRLAEEEFLAALTNDAVVLYAGHTRRFSDAGFYPPLGFTKIAADSLGNRPFFSRVDEALRGAAAPTNLLGLFACHSREYYAGALHAASPRTALIVGPDSSGHEDNLKGLFGAINAVLVRSCEADALRSVNADEKHPAFRVYGLFDASPHLRYARDLNGRVVVIGLLLIPFLVAFASGRSRAARSLVASNGVWRGTARLILLLIPCGFVVGAVSTPAAALPALLTLTGWSALALASAEKKFSFERTARGVRNAAPALAAFLFLYLGANLVREASADNTLSALRQAAAFVAWLVAVAPFAYFGEEALLLPFAGEEGPGFVPACLQALVFFTALWLVLCALAPVYKPRFWPAAALALYGRALSFGLYRRDRRLGSAVAAQAATWAFLIVEGVHALVYN